jgi:N-methylhydantoinase A/oxoprolinase/acetone carboxylase beta subunit
MLLGIDVGGTFTDAVIIDGNQVQAQAKAPTTHHDLLAGVLSALDEVLAGIQVSQLERVALSTTIVTNAVVEGRLDEVELLLLPGPGMDVTGLIPVPARLLSGYIDHRGRERAKLKEEQVRQFCQAQGPGKMFAVVGKFAVRNPVHEQLVAGWVEQYAHPAHITTGAAISGSLNFVRRINSAYYNAAVWRQFGVFAAAIQQAMAERGIIAPVYVLKADGGTMPLRAASQRPVEVVFTGPAASVLGIMALTQMEGAAVSLDIGGTTTDIALWQGGLPLFAEKGATIHGYPTAVRAFWLTSVGLGGDSHVRWHQGSLHIGPQRLGSAMAMGGPAPTVADAMIVAGQATFGNQQLAIKAMEVIGIRSMTPQQVADQVLNMAADKITAAVEAMLDRQAAEPVYRVEDIIQGKRLAPTCLVGVGGAAAGLVPQVARRLHIPWKVPAGAMVANAIGAAVARPTLQVTLRADTSQGFYTIAEMGLKAHLPTSKFGKNEAIALAGRHLTQRAGEAGIPVTGVEEVLFEEFNLIRGFSTIGKVITCQLQIKPGVFSQVMEEGLV